QMAGVSTVVMTNDPLDPAEMKVWLNRLESGPPFQAALRLDKILDESSDAWKQLLNQGYNVDRRASETCTTELRRFIHDCCRRMHPVYIAVSLPDIFQFPEETVRSRVLS